MHPDVLIDFTVAAAAVGNIRAAADHGVALVVGTTGFSDEQVAANRAAIDGRVPAVISSNYAIGVNVFWQLIRQAAPLLAGYDIEVIGGAPPVQEGRALGDGQDDARDPRRVRSASARRRTGARG